LQRSITYTVITKALSTLLNFAIVLVIARHLGPHAKGDITLITTTVTFFLFVSNITGGQVLVYLVPRSQLQDLILPAYVWSLVTALLGFIILWLTDIIPHTYIVPVGIVSLLTSLLAVHQNILLARQKILSYNFLNLFPIAIQAACMVFLFYVAEFNSVDAFIYATYAAYGFTLIFSFVQVNEEIPFKDIKPAAVNNTFSFIIKHGLQYQLVEILQLLNLRFYFYVLTKQQGIEYLGIYSVGISILEAVWLLSRSSQVVNYSNTANLPDKQKNTDATLKLLKTSMLLSGIALFIIALIPSQVYVFIFGEGFSQLRHSVRLLFPGIWIYNIMLVISSLYMGMGKYKPLIIANAAGALTMILCSYLLVPKFVMTGAGLAATLSFAVASIVIVGFYWRDFKAANRETV
jgi:O-antigen/teichoic acid export membrane protein